jgi:hypothetical protein
MNEMTRRQTLKTVREARRDTAQAYALAVRSGNLAATVQCEELDASFAESETRLDGGARALAAAGVPINQVPGEGEIDATIDDYVVPLEQHLQERGIPFRESSAGSSLAALDRGPAPHEQVAALDEALPMGHSDRTLVDRLRAKGSALSEDEAHEARGLAVKHAALLRSQTMQESAGDPTSEFLGAYSEALGEPDLEDLRPRRQVSAEDALALAGVPMR